MGQEQQEQIAFIGGMDLTPYAQGAENISNMRYDMDARAWKNDRSFVSWQHPDDADQTELTTGGVIHSIFSYQVHKQSVHHLVYEQEQTDGTLTLFAIAGPTKYTLRTGRTKPGPNDAGTQYIRMGRYLFILNGVDEPLLYEGNARIRRAFFHEPPQPPKIVSAPGIVPTDMGWVADGDTQHNAARGGGQVAVFPAEFNLGFAPGPEQEAFLNTGDAFISFSIPTFASFEYAVSYVLDTGAESPLSEYSPMVAFAMKGGIQKGLLQGATNEQYKFGTCVTNIPKGPIGTVKRRLYRTKNQKDGLTGAGRTLYFVTEISDNHTTNFFDYCPDSSLGSEAPFAADSGRFPDGPSVGAAFLNHLIVGGSAQYPTTLYYSSGNKPEQFPTFNYIDVGADGGAITQLYAADNICYVFRERAIDVLVPTGNPDSPFTLQPLTRLVGCLAPNSIAMVPGVGVMFLGADKHVYAITSTGSSSFFQGQGQVIKLSQQIYRDLERVGRNSMARAVGVFNSRDNEYWVHCPVDGGDYPTRGYVYHTAIQGWSVREKIPANCFAYIPEGWVVFGSNTDETKLPRPADYTGNRGVMAWCGAKGDGYTISGQNRVQPVGMPNYTFETTWLSLGNPNAIKHLKNIYLTCYRQETGGGTAKFGFDWKPLEYNNDAGQETPSSDDLEVSFLTQNTEQTSAGVYGTATLGGVFDAGSVRDIDKNRFSTREITTVTIAVPQQAYQPTSNALKAASAPALSDARKFASPEFTSDATTGAGGNRWFKIRLSGTNTPIAIIGMTFEYEINGVIKQLHADASKAGSSDSLVNLLGL